MSIARTKYKVTKSMLLLGMLTTGLLSAFVGLVAYFGQNMGTFVISGDTEASQVGIALADNYEFNFQSSRLLVKPAINTNPTTFQDIDFLGGITNDGDAALGDNEDYIAYTFYLKNDGNYAVDLDFTIEMTTATNNIDKVIRIVILEDAYEDEEGKITMSAGYMYYKDENNLHSKYLEALEYSSYYYLFNNMRHYPFKGNLVNNGYKIENFRPDQQKKYSLFIWLEGWDLDSNNSVSKGQLKMKFTFSVSKIID